MHSSWVGYHRQNVSFPKINGMNWISCPLQTGVIGCWRGRGKFEGSTAQIPKLLPNSPPRPPLSSLLLRKKNEEKSMRSPRWKWYFLGKISFPRRIKDWNPPRHAVPNLIWPVSKAKNPQRNSGRRSRCYDTGSLSGDKREDYGRDFASPQ